VTSKRREELDAAFSPSRLVDSLDDYLNLYAKHSADARKIQVAHTQLNLSYGTHERHRLDYFGCGDADAPLVVFVHGGFWSALDQTSFSFPAPACISAGLNYVSLTYRLVPEVSLDEIVGDVATALMWLKANAAHMGFNGNNIILVGHSAGAHLCAMMMVQDTLPIAGAVLISGVYDLVPLCDSYVNDTVGMSKETALANSPYLLNPAHKVPVFITVGDIETPEFKRQSGLLDKAWQPKLTACAFFITADKDHFNILFDLAEPRSVLFQQIYSMACSSDLSTNMPVKD
jgi:arylformamidase